MSVVWKTLWGVYHPLFTVLNPLSARPSKCLNTLNQFVGKLATNCLSVFGHFVGLALKGLNSRNCHNVITVQSLLRTPVTFTLLVIVIGIWGERESESVIIIFLFNGRYTFGCRQAVLDKNSNGVYLYDVKEAADHLVTLVARSGATVAIVSHHQFIHPFLLLTSILFLVQLYWNNIGSNYSLFHLSISLNIFWSSKKSLKIVNVSYFC